MTGFVGRAELTLGTIYRCSVAATVSVINGLWEARVTPLTGNDLMSLDIGRELMPGPWSMTFEGTEVQVEVEHQTGRFYRLVQPQGV